MDQQQIINDIRQYIETNILSGDIKINADTVLQDAGIDSFHRGDHPFHRKKNTGGHHR
ncbi:MAG: hypothetical protein IPI66_04590 [Chitinophagaceae bacterium]|nr:hypothetical protein [Chitinophagaceae bacterium]